MNKIIPLAVRMRPTKLSDIVGQDHLIGSNGLLSMMVKNNRLQNVLLWGPPGSGKTSIAHALAHEAGCEHHTLDATVSGAKDLKSILAIAKSSEKQVILIVDEIHRWPKNTQDILLSAIENNDIVLFGITVENAQFAVNKAILSRSFVLETKHICRDAMVALYKKVQKHYKSIGKKFEIDNNLAVTIIIRSNGDARKLLLSLETLIEIMSDNGTVTANDIDVVIPNKNLHFDASGSEHYDLAHCYQEAIQNSDVNGAIYWLAQWLESGEDPAYICRRMLITAFEDCAGNPFAPMVAMAACYTTEKTGMPECMIPMAMATCEMAMSKRNKSAYNAIKSAIDDVRNKQSVIIPPENRAGSTGWVKAVTKQYLHGWQKDWETIEHDNPRGF